MDPQPVRARTIHRLVALLIAALALASVPRLWTAGAEPAPKRAKPPAATEAKPTPKAPPQIDFDAAAKIDGTSLTVTIPLPPEAQAATNLGSAAFRAGQLEKAKKAFEHAMELAKDHPLALINLAAVEFRLKHTDRAEKLLRRAAFIDPHATAAWVPLGILRFEKNDLDGALAALAQATYLDPRDARAHNYLGATIGRKGWQTGAEMELRRAIELDPDYADAHFNLAVIYLRRSPPAIELARRHYQRALDLGTAPDPLVQHMLKAERKD